MMKLLLDESIPRKLYSHFPASYEVSTVPQMGWAGTKNGKLLALAKGNGFQALITADRGLEYQQNIQDLAVSIITLTSHRTHISNLAPLIPKVVELLENNLSIGVYQIAE